MTGFDEVRVGGYTVSNLIQISEGGFGLIFSCSDGRGTTFALKKCSVERQESFDIVQKEVMLLKRFKDCPYIVTLLGESVNVQRGESYILLEMCSGGHLLDKINKMNAENGIINTRDVCSLFSQVLTAIKFLHTSRPRAIVHRDIKCENVLFGTLTQGGPMVAKLCDFGSCVEGITPLRDVAERTSAEEVIGRESTPAYRAPEMVDLYMRNLLTEKTDIWALGCLLFCICFQRHPFQEAGPLGILNGVVMPPSGTLACDSRLAALIMRMLDFDPEARPDVSACLESVSAVAQNQALPAHHIPEEVQKIKAERDANAAKRLAKNKLAAEKAKRGMAGIIAKKKDTQGGLAQNSVAARRLAQMRGGTVESSVRTTAPNNSILSSAPVNDFFSNASSTTTSSAGFQDDFGNGAKGTSSGASTFDPFADTKSGSETSNSFATNSGNDPFATNAANTTTSADQTAFSDWSDPAPAAPAKVDDFHATKAQGFDNFDSSRAQNSSNGAAFDSISAGFDNSSATAFDEPEPEPAAAPSSLGKLFAAVVDEDAASDFGGAPQPKNNDFASSSSFDFGNASSGVDPFTSSGNVSDPFGNASGTVTGSDFAPTTADCFQGDPQEEFQEDAFRLPSAPASARNSVAVRPESGELQDLVHSLSASTIDTSPRLDSLQSPSSMIARVAAPIDDFLAPPTPQQQANESYSNAGNDFFEASNAAPTPGKTDVLSLFNDVPAPDAKPTMLSNSMSGANMNAFDALGLGNGITPPKPVVKVAVAGQQMQHVMSDAGGAFGTGYAQLASPVPSPRVTGLGSMGTPTNASSAQYLSTPLRNQQFNLGNTMGGNGASMQQMGRIAALGSPASQQQQQQPRQNQQEEKPQSFIDFGNPSSLLSGGLELNKSAQTSGQGQPHARATGTSASRAGVSGAPDPFANLNAF
eukprot:GSChrysophyteH1.ASY1.ANO1.2203.1 assembled CDS